MSRFILPYNLQDKPTGNVIANRSHPDCPDYWWPCLEGSGDFREIINGNNSGIITGSDWNSYHDGRDRVIGPFGTNDYIDTGIILPSHNQWTKCCWLYRTSTGQNRYGLLSYTSSANRIGFYQYSNNYIYVAAANGVSAYGSVYSSNTGWSHITLVYDGTATGNANRLKLYLDGELQTLSFTGTIPATINVNTSVKIHKAGSFYSHSAYSDDHRVYNRPLNQEEINSVISEPWRSLQPAHRPLTQSVASPTTYIPKLGSSDIYKVYLGSTEITKAYLGTTVIYDV